MAALEAVLVLTFKIPLTLMVSAPRRRPRAPSSSPFHAHRSSFQRCRLPAYSPFVPEDTSETVTVLPVIDAGATQVVPSLTPTLGEDERRTRRIERPSRRPTATQHQCSSLHIGLRPCC